MYEKKLFFGRPSPLILIEHLVASLELDQLRQIFDESMNEFSERAVNRMWNPAYAPIDVHNRMREIASEKYEQELNGDLMEFQAGILRKCTKLYTNGVALLVDPPKQVDKIKEIAKNSDCREFDTIFTRQFEIEK